MGAGDGPATLGSVPDLPNFIAHHGDRFWPSTVSRVAPGVIAQHPVTGSPVAKVICNFGRADLVDQAALARLVASISRFLDPCP